MDRNRYKEVKVQSKGSALIIREREWMLKVKEVEFQKRAEITAINVR